jgi:MFS transporter, DHA3 family, tetracycline resistance protein
MLALAPDVIIGGIGLLLASGVSFSVTRAVSVIWVNRRTTSDIRATIHSFLSQAETAGEIVGGLVLLVTAQAAGNAGDVHRLRRAHRMCRRADSDPSSETRNC